MKKVRKIPNFKEIGLKIKKNSQKLVDKNIQIVQDELGKRYVFWSKKSTKIWSFALFFLILPPFIYFYKHSVFKNMFLSKFNSSVIFEIAMNQIDELEFKSVSNVNNKQELYANRFARKIPMDARIVKQSQAVNFKILDKYDAQAQLGLARWVRSYGRNVQVFYKPTGFVKINTQGVWPDFTYFLELHNRWIGKEVQLESKQFNKEFQFNANDLVKARMLYTPLAMEESVNYKKSSKMRYVRVEKKKNQIIISFIPGSINDLNLDVKILSLDNINRLKEKILEDITSDVLKLYGIIYWVLIPPLL